MGAHGDGLAEPQLEELDGTLAPRLALRLVGQQQDRLRGLAEDVRDLRVSCCHAFLRIDDEQDDLRLPYRPLYLLPHEGRVARLRLRLEAPGVRQAELLPSPLHIPVEG